MKFINYEIDETKLKRNYLVYPIKITPNGVHSEKLDKSELLYLYIELNIIDDSPKNIEYFLNNNKDGKVYMPLKPFNKHLHNSDKRIITL